MARQLLTQEQETALMNSLPGEGQAEAPPESASGQQQATPPADAPAPPPEIPTGFRAKLYGQEQEVPFLVDGKPNPQLIERFQLGEMGHRATTTLDQERRAWQAEKEQLASQLSSIPKLQEEIEALRKIAQKAEAFPFETLPQDDDYTKAMVHINSKVERIIQAMPELRGQVNEIMEGIKRDEGVRVVQAELARLKQATGLDEREVNSVMNEWRDRVMAGEQVTTDQVAEQRKAYLDQIGQAAINKWKEQHRQKGEPPAKDAAPAVGGAAPEKISFRDRNRFNESVMAALSAREGG